MERRKKKGKEGQGSGPAGAAAGGKAAEEQPADARPPGEPGPGARAPQDQALRAALAGSLRRLRELRGLSLAKAAAAAALAQERLARCEQGSELPDLRELFTLARIYEVSPALFFTAEPRAERVEVVRAGERWTVNPTGDAAEARNFRYEALSYRLTDRVMAPFIIYLPPEERSVPEPLGHEGEEFLYVLSGLVEIAVNRRTYRLEEGDTIYFDARLPHTLHAGRRRPASLLACLIQVHRPEARHPVQRAYQ